MRAHIKLPAIHSPSVGGEHMLVARAIQRRILSGDVNGLQKRKNLSAGANIFAFCGMIVLTGQFAITLWNHSQITSLCRFGVCGMFTSVTGMTNAHHGRKERKCRVVPEVKSGRQT
jgi:hypothetical protein